MEMVLNDAEFICPHFFKHVAETHERSCGGCAHWDVDYATEVELKKEKLKSLLNSNVEIRVLAAATHRTRTRFDFTISSRHAPNEMGLYDAQKRLVNLTACEQLHPELERAFLRLKEIFAQSDVRIDLGSARLRVSEDLKKWGLWLDFSNVQILDLLIEKNFLNGLSKEFTIEIGQKKKRLDLNSFDMPQLKLTDPKPENWFKSLDHPLVCSISSFTQPGWETADLITKQVCEWVENSTTQSLIEYGSGIGQFTVPLADKFNSISVFETDLIALDDLKINLGAAAGKVKINNRETFNNDLSQFTALVNPPRSGLNNFTNHLFASKTNQIIYISCYPESLAADLRKLSHAYTIVDIVLVDQFPRTNHFESCVLLQRIE